MSDEQTVHNELEEVETTESNGTILDNMKGQFVESLKRNNRKIREDRAIVIAEAAELKFKREIEDMKMRMKRLKRERDQLLDLSPTHADSLVLSADFDESKFVAEDLRLGLEIRNLEIKLEIAEARYKLLFT